MDSPKSSGIASILLDWLRERFTRNQGAPLPGKDMPQRRGFIITMCIVVAVVLWFTLSIGETYTIFVEMDTLVTNVPPDTALAMLPPSSVQVQVRGAGTALFGLRFDPPRLPIDAAEDVVNVSTQVNLPQGVSAVSFIPQSFTLYKEQLITRKIPIRSRAVIEPAASYDFFSPPVLTPDSIEISGARSVVEALEAWPTVPFRRTGLEDTLTVVVALVDTLAGLVTASHAETTLSTRAHQFSEDSRVLRVEVTEQPTTQRGVELDPPSVTVKYIVPVSQYQAAQRAPDFFATVSYDVIRTDATGRVQPEIHYPTQLMIRPVSIEPSTLRYFISLSNE